MKNFTTRLSLLFSAGALGGLGNALAVGLYQSATATQVLGVNLSQPLTPAMIYQRVVWGGLWGFIFLVPLRIKDVFARGLFFSLAPTLVQLLVVFPSRGQGLFGVEQGPFTFVPVLIFNALWGLVAALWLRLLRQD